MQLALAFIADTQATKLMKPADRPLHDPAVPSQPLTALDPSARDPGHDPALAQPSPVSPGIIAFVGMQLLRTPARSSALLPDRRDRIDQGHQLGALVDVCRRDEDRERMALPIHQNVIFGAWLAPIGRVFAGFSAPFLAGTVAASALARLQSIWPASPSFWSMSRCSFCQTPH
jgi:hypothetical protein